MLPLSTLNALRREALEALDAARMAAMPTPAAGYDPKQATDTAQALAAAAIPHGEETLGFTARFYEPAAITEAAADYFRILYLPVGKSHPSFLPQEKRGVIIPPVIFDREAQAFRTALSAALASGIRHLLVGNLGHLPLIRAVAEDCGLSAAALHLHGDLRLNIANTPAAARYLSLGMEDVILSPELTPPRVRDISRALEDTGHPAAVGYTVYGRLPLMLLEKCAIREVYRHRKPDAVCREICGENAAVMKDRMGKEFPILRESGSDGREHRNLICNSLPTGMSDRPDELARLGVRRYHFIFTVESPAEVDKVISAYRDSRPLGREVRRFPK
jgi:putative protease